jgi:hypothetical protein
MGMNKSNTQPGRGLVLISRVLHIMLDIELKRAHYSVYSVRARARTGSNHKADVRFRDRWFRGGES